MKKTAIFAACLMTWLTSCEPERKVSEPERKVSEKLNIENITMIGSTSHVTKNGVNVYLGESWFGDNKDNISLSYYNDEDHDNRMGTKAKRDALSEKLSKIEGVKGIRLKWRCRYELAISAEDWKKQRETILDTFTKD